MKRSKHIGSTLDSFLEEEGIKEEVNAVAAKRVLAWMLRETMEKQKINKAEMARRMDTSRSQLDRVLDPRKDGVRLDTIQKAARAVGKKLVLELA